MELEIRPLDPADEPTVEGVQALRVAAEAADVPDFPPPCPYAFRSDLTFPRTSKRTVGAVAWRAGEVAGYLALELPLQDNLDNAEVVLTVHPAHRRRGVGRALHAYAVAQMRELGRSWLVGNSVESLPGGPAREPAGRGFATALGAKAALDEVRSRLDLTALDEAALEDLLAGAQARAAGYRLASWRGRTPDEYVADAAYLSGRLASDSPMGDLKWDAPQVDVARRREWEDGAAAARWHVYATGAVHEESGRLVALTDIARQESTPWHAFQWITLVDPPHRGHRLGALVKVTNLRLAQSHEPALRVIDTWNATVNRHMRAINEAMGYRPVDSWVNWQQEV